MGQPRSPKPWRQNEEGATLPKIPSIVEAYASINGGEE